MNRYFSNAGERQGITVGVAGTATGSGSTHFALLFANYLSAVEQKRTALLEWNATGAFRKLERICTGDEGKRPFSVLDVDYYPDSTGEELGICLSRYEVLVLDFGVLREECTIQFHQCGIVCLLGSFSEWKLEELISSESWILQGRKRWHYLMTFGSEEARKEAVRRYRMPFRRVPFVPDAFSINRETALFLEEIWRDKREKSQFCPRN